jgi:SNF2 family DNA or RNA helicase
MLQFVKYDLIHGADKTIESKIRDICISLNAKDCLTEVPEILYIDHKIRLSDNVYRRYKEFERDRIIDLAKELGINRASNIDSVPSHIVAVSASALRTKLLQYANGAVYNSMSLLNNHSDGYIEFHEEKIRATLDIIESVNGAPVLLTYAYRHDLDRLLKALTKKGIKARQYQNVKDKNDWNVGKIEVLLVHPQSAGYGLNLQEGGSIIVWFGLTDNLEYYQQLNKRLHRSGQKEVVRCIRIIASGTEDEKVVKNLIGKNATQETLMESLKAKFIQCL